MPPTVLRAQVLEELIQLAKDIRASRERGEESGLSDEEIAFYDALAQNGSAREVMGEPKLRVIAHELVTSVKNTVTVDWMHREAARARMRVLVKKILRKLWLSSRPSGYRCAGCAPTGGSPIGGMVGCLREGQE